MTLRTIILKVHLYLGLAAAVFLIVLGVTGAIIAFESDIDHWMRPALWYVHPTGDVMPEAALIAKVEQQYAPARVTGISFLPQRNLAQAMQLTDRSTVTVNPYDGTILGRSTGPTATQIWLGKIHQVHLRLATDPRASFGPAGKKIVSYAGLVLFFLVPTGFILWWRTKRASIGWKGSWFRICFDAHHTIGIYAGLFLWCAAFTGILIGFDEGEKAIYSLTHSEGPTRLKQLQSTPAPGAAAIGSDQAFEIAHRAIPSAAIDQASLPANPKGVYTVVMRVPEETSGSAHSYVTIDQYSGQVLQVHNFLTDSQGYRWIRFNRSIHTGDIYGLAGHIVMSLSSLLLVAMAISGVVIWWKKLAV